MTDKTGTEANNDLIGGTNNDTLTGLGGVDRLYGNGGNDSLHGGSDRDELSGGDGNGYMVVRVTTSSKADQVMTRWSEMLVTMNFLAIVAKK